MTPPCRTMVSRVSRGAGRRTHVGPGPGPAAAAARGLNGAAGSLRRAETGSISYVQTLLNDLANGSFPSLFMPEHILFVNGKVSS